MKLLLPLAVACSLASACLPIVPPADPALIDALVVTLVMDPNVVAIAPGKSKQLNAKALNANSTQIEGVRFNWTSLNPNLVPVDPNNGTVNIPSSTPNNTSISVQACLTSANHNNMCATAMVNVDTSAALTVTHAGPTWTDARHTVQRVGGVPGLALDVTPLNPRGETRRWVFHTGPVQLLAGSLADSALSVALCEGGSGSVVELELDSGQLRPVDPATLAAPDLFASLQHCTGDEP